MTDDHSDDRADGAAGGDDDFTDIDRRDRRTEPSPDERERAARIRRLREGEAEPRGRRRRPAVPDEDDLEEAPADVEVDHEGPVQPDEELTLPADAPADLSVASLYLTEDLRAKMERIEEHLHLRYSVEYDADLDGPRYVRPLALYLGVRQFERLHLEEVRALFHEVDVVESPE